MLATGKQYSAIIPLIEQLELTAPQITSHGALVTDPAQNIILHQQCIPLEPGRTASLSNLGPAEDGTVQRVDNSVLGWPEGWLRLPTWGAVLDERRAEGECWTPRLAPEWSERARGPPRSAA